MSGGFSFPDSCGGTAGGVSVVSDAATGGFIGGTTSGGRTSSALILPPAPIYPPLSTIVF